ncbi:hypothetical protein BW13_08490 [Bifidobacterium sp. UTCIF-37]|nr:hypothetical protein BW13_08490 [Bifidobacterium sp. UTCIF-37]TPF87796.1 hypothetical protein BW11_09825 [Bifidobacterium sp. UTCIF-38]
MYLLFLRQRILSTGIIRLVVFYFLRDTRVLLWFYLKLWQRVFLQLLLIVLPALARLLKMELMAFLFRWKAVFLLLLIKRLNYYLRRIFKVSLLIKQDYVLLIILLILFVINGKQ